VSYHGKISTFGRDFGVTVEVFSADGLPLEDLLSGEEAKRLDDFLVTKHRELELAFMASRR